MVIQYSISGPECNFSHPMTCYEYISNICSDNHCDYYIQMCAHTREWIKHVQHLVVVFMLQMDCINQDHPDLTKI